MSKLTIGIIGARGFIGGNYVSQLKDKYNIVTGDLMDRDIDIRCPESVNSWFEKNQPMEKIILTAAMIRQQEILHDPVGGMATNVTGVINVLNACKKYKCMLLFSSTVHVYEGLTGVVSEQTPLDSNQPKHLYTQSKIIAEELIRSYNALYSVDYLILRYGVLYGPGSHSDMVVNRFIQLANVNQDLQIFGTGEQQRCFVHIDDLCAAVGRCIGRNVINTTINLCESTNYTVLQLAEIIQREKNTNVTNNPGRTCDLSSPIVDNSRAYDLLSWTPTQSLNRYVMNGLEK